MLTTLLLLAATAALYLWRPHGPEWLRAVPEWVFLVLLLLLALYAVRLGVKWLRGTIRDLSD